jgi:hypothetical protein
MKLGSDFNASTPADSDYVRTATGTTAAGVLRDLRSRMKEFFAVLFDTASGDFKDDVIPSSALEDSKSTPGSGDRAFERVQVDSRGFVVKGYLDPEYRKARVFRAFYLASGGWQEGPGGKTDLSAPVTEIWPSGGPPHVSPEGAVVAYGKRYEFVVPAGISRLKAMITSGGDVTEAGTVTAGFDVTPQGRLVVFVGDQNTPSFVAAADFSSYITSESYVAGRPTGTVLSDAGPQFRPAGTAGNPGSVLLEWYA